MAECYCAFGYEGIEDGLCHFCDQALGAEDEAAVEHPGSRGAQMIREADLDEVRIALLNAGLSSQEADAILGDVKLLLDDRR